MKETVGIPLGSKMDYGHRTTAGEASKLLALIRSLEADEELAVNVEEAMAWRRTLKFREATV